MDRANQVSRVCRKHGLTVEADDLINRQRIAGTKGESSTFRAAIESLSISETIVKEIQSTVKWSTKPLMLYPGVKDTLKRISRSSTLVIVANQSRPVTQRLMDYGIHEYFDMVVCSCEVGCDKPDPAIFLIVAEKYGQNDREYWMIGDRIDNDIKPVKALGWKTIRVKQGDHKDYAPRAGENADFTTATFAEVTEIIK